MQIYDTVIVGAGIAGLYTAFLLKLQNPKTTLLVIEQNRAIHLGGRANTESFYGTNISIGAGIGRMKKDKHLIELMRHFHIPIHSYIVEHHMATTSSINVKETMQLLKRAYEQNMEKMRNSPEPFSLFAKKVLGNTDYNRFLNSTGFTDYENEDAYETIYEYGMEDNLGNWPAFSVPWNDVCHLLAQSVDKSTGKHFVFGKKVTQIEKDVNNICRVFAKDNSTKTYIYLAKQVIVATTVNTLRTLFPRHPIYKDIESQPFLRVYGKFDKSSVGILKEVVPKFTYVDAPVQKIIPINVDNGVYMIVYNDNANSLAFKSHTENTELNRRFYEKCIEKTLRIPKGSLHLIAIRSFYWKQGTHYYKPLNTDLYKNRSEFIRKSQHPEENIFVVGELVSRNQGWVEGALESVHKIIDEIIEK